MGKYFKEFCDAQRKIRITGHVPNVIDMCQADQDAAVVAMLKDSGQISFANCHPSMSNEDKNESYQSLELVIQDCIDKYNHGVDIQNEQVQVNSDELGCEYAAIR